MAPKPKASPHVYVVVSASAGVDSVHVSIESAQARAAEAKHEGLASLRLEVHSIVGGKALLDAEKNDAAIKAKPEAKEADVPVVTANQADGKDAPQTGASSTSAPANANASSSAKADPKPKETPKPKAKESKPKEPKPESAAKPKESKPKEPKSESKPKAADKATDKDTSAKTPSKTVSADEQRAANAKKGTPLAEKDLPANIQTLLASTSDALEGLHIVVTGIPPIIGRKNAEKLVTSHGGKLGKSISGKTQLVVLGNDAGPKKLEQIKELAVRTMDEQQLVDTLEKGGATMRKRAASEEDEDDDASAGGKAKKSKK